MKERVRNGFLVALITALVWLYAEAESLQGVQPDLRVSFVADGEQVVHVLSEDWRGTVRSRIEGSATAVQRVQRAFTISPGMPGFPMEEGEQTVDLLAALRQHPEMEGMRLALLAVEPRNVRVRIDPVLELSEVEVRVALTGADLAGPPRATPGTATVRAPRPVIEELRSTPGGAYVVARVDQSVVDSAVAGRETRVRVPLVVPRAIGAGTNGPVAVTPSEVQVEFTVRQRVAETTVASAPVQILLPPPEIGRWDVRVPPEDAFVRDATVSGPEELVARFMRGEQRLVAIVSLSSDELERQITQKEASFAMLRDGSFEPLPAGVRVQARDQRVSLEVRRRTEAAPTTTTQPQ